MNKVYLIGNLTRDPEHSTTTNGISVCRFSLAVSRRYANQDGERQTDFINCVAWRGLADNISKYLKKGSKACVVGSLQTRSYEAQDGTKRNVTEVIAEDCEFLSSKNSYSDDEPKTNSLFDGEDDKPAGAKPTFDPVDDDDLPF